MLSIVEVAQLVMFVARDAEDAVEGKWILPTQNEWRKRVHPRKDTMKRPVAYG